MDRLESFGEESKAFWSLLKPVLTRFVRSFEAPDAPDVIDFWQRIAQERNMGSGPNYLCGWIRAFCFWNEDGECLAPKSSSSLGMPGYSIDGVKYHIVTTSKIPNGYTAVPVTVEDNGESFQTTMVAGSVGVKVTTSGRALVTSKRFRHDNLRHLIRGEEGRSAASVERSTSSAELLSQVLKPGEIAGPDTVQPQTGWWMYERTDADVKANPVEKSDIDKANVLDELYC